MHKVSYEAKSGRPIAPMWWRVLPFFVIFAWLMAAMMLLFAYLGVRDGKLEISAAAVMAGGFILVFVYREKIRIERKRVTFNESVAAYERAISGKS